MTFILYACLLSALSAPAWADPPRPTEDAAPVPGEVTVKVLVVRATNSHSRIDPELDHLAEKLKRIPYSGFTLIDRQLLELRNGRDQTIAIEGGRELEVELLSHDELAAKVRLVLIGPQGRELLNTTVSIHRNRAFIVAGPKVGESDILVLPVIVKY